MRMFLLALVLGLLSATGAMAQLGSSTLFPPDYPVGETSCRGFLFWENGQNLRCVGEIPTCLPGQTVKFDGATGRLACSGTATTGGGGKVDVSCPSGQYLAGIDDGKADCRTLPAGGGDGGGRTGPRELISSSTFSTGNEVAIPSGARFVEIEGFCVQYRWNKSDGHGFYGNDAFRHTLCMKLEVGPALSSAPGGESKVILKVDPITTVLDIPVGPTELYLNNMAKKLGNVEVSDPTGRVRFYK